MRSRRRAPSGGCGRSTARATGRCRRRSRPTTPWARSRETTERDPCLDPGGRRRRAEEGRRRSLRRATGGSGRGRSPRRAEPWGCRGERRPRSTPRRKSTRPTGRGGSRRSATRCRAGGTRRWWQPGTCPGRTGRDTPAATRSPGPTTRPWASGGRSRCCATCNWPRSCRPGRRTRDAWPGRPCVGPARA